MKPVTNCGIKSRIVWNDPEGISYETRRALPLTAALRQARMFAGNRRVLRACVVRHGDGCRVRIYPSSLTSLYSRAMAASERRRNEQGERYTYEQLRPGTWRCRSCSGAAYVITRAGCSCAQYMTRLRHVGASCKHMLEADRRGLFSSVEAA